MSLSIKVPSIYRQAYICIQYFILRYKKTTHLNQQLMNQVQKLEIFRPKVIFNIFVQCKKSCFNWISNDHLVLHIKYPLEETFVTPLKLKLNEYLYRQIRAVRVNNFEQVIMSAIINSFALYNLNRVCF